MPVLLLKRNPIIIFGCYTQDAVTLQGLHSGWNSYERYTSDRYLFLFHTRWKLEFELPVEGKQALSNCKLREINSPPSILELCNNTLRIICLLPVSSPQCKSLSRHIEDIISCVVLWPGGFEPIGISSSWALRAKVIESCQIHTTQYWKFYEVWRTATILIFLNFYLFVQFILCCFYCTLINAWTM